LLPPLADVDYAEDLIACRRHASAFTANFPPPQPDLISIVIPTLNEAGSLSSTLDPLRNLPNLELVVADGGSTDGTPELARQLGAMVVPAQRGRGVQLNAGAALARGATLLFLHADSQLPERFQETVHTLLRTPCVAGAFRLAINAPGWPLRWVERGANTRARWLQLPYGDQGLFLAAERFFSVGGFPPWPILEDYELCRRLRRTGAIRLADEVVRTSARRWQKLGVVRTTLINQATLLGFHLGVPPQRLARWYTGFMPRS
jgi:rSAM/selenodomain-associated transferase 2